MEYIHDQTFTQIRSYELVHTDFENCLFQGCDFSTCDFTGTVFINCRFLDCDFNGAEIGYVAFREAEFVGCQFQDVNFARVSQNILRMTFSDCILDRAKFYGVSMPKTRFENCSLIAVDFMGCDLTGALFSNCDLHRANLTDIKATQSDFLTSYNFVIDPEKAQLKGALFSHKTLAGLLQKYQLKIQ